MILIDSNIFMYAAGGSHPLKQASVEFLERVARSEVEAAVDAEVLQEILHRYRAIDRWSDGTKVFDLARVIVPVVLPVSVEVLDEARSLMDRNERLSARDAVHAAAAIRNGIQQICSFDGVFDAIEGIERVEPGQPLNPA